jgi:hypothetical protein
MSPVELEVVGHKVDLMRKENAGDGTASAAVIACPEIVIKILVDKSLHGMLLQTALYEPSVNEL